MKVTFEQDGWMSPYFRFIFAHYAHIHIRFISILSAKIFIFGPNLLTHSLVSLNECPFFQVTSKQHYWFHIRTILTEFNRKKMHFILDFVSAFILNQMKIQKSIASRKTDTEKQHIPTKKTIEFCFLYMEICNFF